MQYKVNRKDEPILVDRLEVTIGDNTYRLTESIDGKLGIQKSTTGDEESILVYPRVTNVIEIQ
tara:strand:+ start:1847 stop:2035 length:189 start_codon:yes stop_codon:yes gene_type:complete